MLKHQLFGHWQAHHVVRKQQQDTTHLFIFIHGSYHASEDVKDVNSSGACSHTVDLEKIEKEDFFFFFWYYTGTEQKNSQFHINEMLSITAVAISFSFVFLQQSISAFFVFIFMPTQHSFQCYSQIIQSYLNS